MPTRSLSLAKARVRRPPSRSCPTKPASPPVPPPPISPTTITPTGSASLPVPSTPTPPPTSPALPVRSLLFSLSLRHLGQLQQRPLRHNLSRGYLLRQRHGSSLRHCVSCQLLCLPSRPHLLPRRFLSHFSCQVLLRRHKGALRHCLPAGLFRRLQQRPLRHLLQLGQFLR